MPAPYFAAGCLLRDVAFTSYRLLRHAFFFAPARLRYYFRQLAAFAEALR